MTAVGQRRVPYTKFIEHPDARQRVPELMPSFDTEQTGNLSLLASSVKRGGCEGEGEILVRFKKRVSDRRKKER